ncbi:hypothetical protein GCM10020331_052460 [Ectobacillus funiculus]
MAFFFYEQFWNNKLSMLKHVVENEAEKWIMKKASVQKRDKMRHLSHFCLVFLFYTLGTYKFLAGSPFDVAGNF